MGLNIIAYEVEDCGESEFGGRDLKTVRFEGFDSLRYTGDRELIFTKEIEWDMIDEDENDLWSGKYFRPKDIDKALEWVERNVPEGNKGRLRGLFNEMKLNHKLYVYFSY